MGYSVLVTDDEENIRKLIRKYAEFEGHTVTEAATGMEAVSLARSGGFDVIILDVMLPELDGFSACREIRKTSDTPIIMLSARGEEYDRLSGFGFGADDYVVKPFSPKELMSRVDAIMRRVGKRAEPAAAPVPAVLPAHDEYISGGLRVDFTGRLVWIDGVRADLSPKEYELLFYLVKNRNIALTREKLITEVWGYDFFGDDRTLDTHVKLLRRSLGKYSAHIVTLRGVGYRFESDH